ncbi:MAG: YbaK/EbsC family protein [Gammaproteobacteria bacterium]|nr:YbaK/EbsC family protein [Gammaproteobacteria bacterium]MDH4255240.1 YbaK/EbsC family protein [Gammaproteobacteria bacterium]MDH5310051.1 YbaK/EbsC family protein [Gammaproteobacteria bacterium]
MTLRDSEQSVQDFLRDKGFSTRVEKLPMSTRTAVEAADAVGCSVAQIAKSLVFRALDSDRAVLVIASGANRVDESRVAQALGERIGKADATFVRERTGFVIGGVPPVAHKTECPVFIDRDLFALDCLWAAAGTPNAIFRTTADDLCDMTGGRVIDLKLG